MSYPAGWREISRADVVRALDVIGTDWDCPGQCALEGLPDLEPVAQVAHEIEPAAEPLALF